MSTGTPTTFANLNQWKIDDELIMDDFNQDNAKIDQALAQKVDLTVFEQYAAQNSLYTATAAYNAGIFTLAGLPETLPAIFTVRFTAPTAYSAGDKLRAGTKDIRILTTNMHTPDDGAFLAGTIVNLDVDYTGGHAFFKQGGGSGSTGGTVEYGILPSQTKIDVISRDASIRVNLTNPGGAAYAGTRLVVKPGSEMPRNKWDGLASDVGIAATHTVEGLENNQPYMVRAFAYNQAGDVQTDVNGAVQDVTPLAIIPAGHEWTIRQSAANNPWYSVCYGNGLFVAVAYSGIGAGNLVMTSPDGANWTIRQSAADNDWRSVCYGNGLFVAVASTGIGNRVMTSPNGINWTIRQSAANNEWHSVCYGNGLFVAVANTGVGNRVMTSPNGINWTIRQSAANNEWLSVCFGNGLFVAAAYSGTSNRVMTSPNGATWTIRQSAADNTWRSVCYGNGLFVAVANTGVGNRVMTSPDGINWTIRQSAGDNGWFSVCYGNSLFVAVANSGTGNRVMTSPDGINWTLRQSAANNSWYSVCYGNGLFVAVAANGIGNRVMTSSEVVNQ